VDYRPIPNQYACSMKTMAYGRLSKAESLLPRFLVQRVLAFAAAVFLQLQLLRAARLLLRPVIPVAARAAFHPDVFSHGIVSVIRAVRQAASGGSMTGVQLRFQP
jgi:hypothetical protein